MESQSDEFQSTRSEQAESDLGRILMELRQLNAAVGELDITIARAGVIDNLDVAIVSIDECLQRLERTADKLDRGILEITGQLEEIRQSTRQMSSLETTVSRATRNYHPWFVLVVLLLTILVYKV